MKQVFEQVSRTLLCGVFCFSSIIAFATPTISDLKVASIEPLGVAIDYTVSGATEDDVTPLFVSLSANGTNCVAQTLSGATNCVNGSHRVYWNMAKDGLSLDPMTAFLTVAYEYPLYCVIDLAGGSATNAYPITYMNTEPEDGFNTTGYKTTKLVLKRVDAGTFIMGDDQTNESHRVTLTKPFYMGLFEVTQKQWYQVTGSNPSSSYGRGDAYPVCHVSYDAIRGSSTGAKWPTSNAVDASSFLGKLRAKTGTLLFDLPTEAQWEYACRAGTTTTYSYGDSANGDYMWHTSNSSSETHEVGTKLPNKWGFYDMHGNVWEWCRDWYGTLAYGTDPKGSSSGSSRVKRGGSLVNYAGDCTSSDRSYLYPSYNDRDYCGGSIGFRLSCTLSSLAETDAASATTEFALGYISADGSSVDGQMSLGYAPSASGNAVVAINDEVLLNASEAGSWTWTAQTAGVYAVSHTVGDDVMSASYVVTNGYAKVAETPNPPMELVAGITLSPSGEVSVAAKKTRQLIRISGSGETWTGATSAEWLTLNYTNGTAQGDSIVCTVSENVDADARVGYAYIAGQTLKVTQAGRGVTVDGSVVADGAGGEIAVAITVAEGTTWSASSECPWIAVSSQNGTDSGEVVLNVLPWNNAVPRVGTVTIAGQTVTVTQNAAQFECLTGTETNVVANGESGALEIVATRGVVWSATSDAVWLVVAEDSEMRRGSGMIFWTAQPQSTTESRMATITVTAGELDGGRALTFTVTQAAARVELSAASVEVVAQGKTLSVDVATADGVEWSIADVPEWIALDGDETRRGADAVTLVVSPNTTFEERAATIVIAGKEFVVTQNAAKVEIEGGAIRCCTTAGIEALIATVRVDVATASWKVEISKDAKNWVFFIESSEDVPGDGTFELYVIPAEDGDTLPRTATVTVGNATLSIVQDDRVAIDDGYMSFFIPTSWFAQYPTLGGTTVAEWQAIAEGDGVKANASGVAMPVWQDYVAGTDPTNALSKFTAKIEMKDGAPVVTWSPALNGEGVREGARVYRVWGKANLDDAAWSEVGVGGESAYRFFRVTVEMP